LSSQRIASGTTTRSSTTPITGSTSGMMSIGEITYSTIIAVPSFSHPGAAGWRRANHSCLASLRRTVQSSSRRFHIARVLRSPAGRPCAA
jgi:hypothetical protein